MPSLARIPDCFSDRHTDDSLTPGTYDDRIDSTSWPASPGLVPLVVENLALRSPHIHPTLGARIHANSLQEVVVDRSFRFPAPPRAPRPGAATQQARIERGDKTRDQGGRQGRGEGRACQGSHRPDRSDQGRGTEPVAAHGDAFLPD